MLVRVPATDGVPLVGDYWLYEGRSLSPTEAVAYIEAAEAHVGWTELSDVEYLAAWGAGRLSADKYSILADETDTAIVTAEVAAGVAVITFYDGETGDEINTKDVDPDTNTATLEVVSSKPGTIHIRAGSETVTRLNEVKIVSMAGEEFAAIKQAVTELDAAIKATKIAGQIATRELIKAGQLTAEEIAGIVELYPAWATGIAYVIGDLVSYSGSLYEVIQAHTSQSDWTPDVATSLFKSHTPSGVIADWVQPTGSHDAYQIGDRVLFEGKIYESTIDDNVWSPTEYPAGWQEVTA